MIYKSVDWNYGLIGSSDVGYYTPKLRFQNIATHSPFYLD